MEMHIEPNSLKKSPVKRDPVKIAKKMLLKWAILIGLGVLSFAVGITLGYRNYQLKQAKISEPSAPSYNQSNTEPPTSPTTPH